jgi:hypothetical protein
MGEDEHRRIEGADCVNHRNIVRNVAHSIVQRHKADVDQCSMSQKRGRAILPLTRVL